MQLPTINPRPSRVAVLQVVDQLRSILFPGYFDVVQTGGEGYRYYLGHSILGVRSELIEQVMRDICFRCTDRNRMKHCREEAQEKVDAILAELPAIRESLALDADAAYRGDPAATSQEEAVFCYPGLAAVTYHRLAHQFYKNDVPLLARIIAELSHSQTGIDIHPGAMIGDGLFIDHGTGVVIGETAIIGRNVRIYQGVTLGARSFPTDESGYLIKGVPRHPVVEDDVVIYSGATVLGRITIGKGSIVGGNVWLTEDLPPYSRVSQGKLKQERFEGGAGI